MKKLIALSGYHKELIKTLVIVLIVSAIYFFVLADLKFFAIPKLKSQDIMTRIYHLIAPPPKNLDKIVVVAVDDDSFKLLNKKWPWPRLMFAFLVDRLSPYNPKVIALDFSFIGKSELKNDDVIIQEAFRDAGNVLSASYFSREGEYLKPLKEISDASRGYGFINKPRDVDLYVRRARSMLYSKEDETLEYSLILKTFALFRDLPLEDIKYDGKNVMIKDTAIPVDKEGVFPINFSLKFNEFQVIPFWKILKTDFPAETFKDKIILVGPTNEILHDVHNTPFGLLPGVIVNANELLTLINNSFVKYLPKWQEFLLLCIFVICISILTYRAIKPRIIFKVIGAIVIFWQIGLLLYSYNIRLDYFAPVGLIIISYVGISIFKSFRLLVQNIALKTQAITDELTGLFTYRYFVIRLHSEMERAKRYNIGLSLVIMDIDHFKKINDTYGHQTGNVILREVSEILKTSTRKADVPFRYGGEEICVILTHTSKEGAMSYSEKMRQLIEEHSFAGAKSIKITLSFGISSYPIDNAFKEKEMINAADIALYHAKEAGRNRVVAYDSTLLASTKTKTLE
ncbi:MAG: diguanylate cyclase [Candidatus Omnitrophota bacterium]